MADSCEHENEPSVSIKFGEFPHQVTTCYFLMQGSAALSPPIKCGFHSAKFYERNNFLRTSLLPKFSQVRLKLESV